MTRRFTRGNFDCVFPQRVKRPIAAKTKTAAMTSTTAVIQFLSSLWIANIEAGKYRPARFTRQAHLTRCGLCSDSIFE